jgi:uncharacterized protein YxjI
MSSAPQFAAGWYQDPSDASQWRWHDGTQWTQQTAPMQAPQAAVQVATTTGSSDDPWRQPRYVISQKIVTIGSRYELQLPTPATANSDKPEPGQLVAFVQRKRIAIKEKITFMDASERELYTLVAPKFMTVTQKYELRTPDGATFAHLRKNVGLFRSTWRLLDAQERELAVATETSGVLAIGRRIAGFLPLGFVIDMIPYEFTVSAGADNGTPGAVLGTYQRRYGMRDRYDLDLRGDAGMSVDRRGMLALAIALDVLQNR